jgi:hypothetical protein
MTDIGTEAEYTATPKQLTRTSAANAAPKRCSESGIDISKMTAIDISSARARVSRANSETRGAADTVAALAQDIRLLREAFLRREEEHGLLKTRVTALELELVSAQSELASMKAATNQHTAEAREAVVLEARATARAQVEQATAAFGKLTKQVTTSLEATNRLQEETQRKQRNHNARVMGVPDAMGKIVDRDRLREEAQKLVNSVTGIAKGTAVVAEAKVFRPKMRAGGSETAQTCLTVTFLTPGMARAAIRAARAARRAAAESNGGWQRAGAKKKGANTAKGKGKAAAGSSAAPSTPQQEVKVPYFAYDLTPENQHMKKRMEEQLEQWKHGSEGVDAWCDVVEGVPVLLRRSAADRQGGRGPVQEFVWKPDDAADPSKGKFVPGSHRVHGQTASAGRAGEAL